MSVRRWDTGIWLAAIVLPLCLVCPGWAAESQTVSQLVAEEPPSPATGEAVVWLADEEGAEAPPLIRDLVEGGVAVPQALGEGEAVAGPMAEGESSITFSDEESLWGGYCGEGGCGGGSCGESCEPACDRFWVQAELLGWWTQGMSVVPLVTASPIANPQGEGILGQVGTRVLHGGEPQMEGDRWGTRYRIGMWRDCCQAVGFQAEYFSLGDSQRYYQYCDGTNGVLARPFFNTLTNLPDSELVCRAGVLTGSVSVDFSSQLDSAGFLARFNLRCGDPCGDPCVNSRTDFLLGYRYMQLDEHLLIREDLTSVAVNPTHFDIMDSFDTRSDFHGVEFGMLYERQSGRLSFEVLAKIALGNAHDEVTIDGSTATTLQGVTTNFQGGLLAQRTNIGSYEQDSFAVIPELGITVGYDITCNLRATLGYTFIYWNHVARPGDQINPNVNPNLLPPENVSANPFGPLTPTFSFQDTDYWAQGFNLGLEYVW